LFHGPGAREAAVAEQHNLGRPISEPIGDEGIKIDDARRIIDLMEMAPVGDQPGVLVFGPIDRAQQSASDVLLKVVEEFHSDGVRPVIWATDLGSVSNTIRSRCLHRWCPYAEHPIDDSAARSAASVIISAVLHGDRAGVISETKDFLDALPDAKVAMFDLLAGIAKVLAEQPDELNGPRYELWMRARKLLSYRHISRLELTARLVEAIE